MMENKEEINDAMNKSLWKISTTINDLIFKESGGDFNKKLFIKNIIELLEIEIKGLKELKEDLK